jgi:hypothetical protein
MRELDNGEPCFFNRCSCDLAVFYALHKNSC